MDNKKKLEEISVTWGEWLVETNKTTEWIYIITHADDNQCPHMLKRRPRCVASLRARRIEIERQYYPLEDVYTDEKEARTALASHIARFVSEQTDYYELACARDRCSYWGMTPPPQLKEKLEVIEAADKEKEIKQLKARLCELEG